jgi:hypothetical protein
MEHYAGEMEPAQRRPSLVSRVVRQPVVTIAGCVLVVCSVAIIAGDQGSTGAGRETSRGAVELTVGKLQQGSGASLWAALGTVDADTVKQTVRTERTLATLSAKRAQALAEEASDEKANAASAQLPLNELSCKDSPFGCVGTHRAWFVVFPLFVCGAIGALLFWGYQRFRDVPASPPKPAEAPSRTIVFAPARDYQRLMEEGAV